MPATISGARLGPERAQRFSRAWGISSARTSLIRLPESISRPLVALTTTDEAAIASFTARALERIVREGTAMTTSSVPRSASSGDAVTVMPGGSLTPGRRRRFSPVLRISSASAEVRAQSATSTPARAAIMARVVPQLVVPTTPIWAISGPCSGWTCLLRRCPWAPSRTAALPPCTA